MDSDLDWIASIMKAERARKGARIQSLWSGYGELFRVELAGAEVESVVVKSVKPPEAMGGSPRSSEGLSHARKRRSYDVEECFYRTLSNHCDVASRVPHFFGSRKRGDGWLIVLEDLDAAGFPLRARAFDRKRTSLCIAWLANFHARFLGSRTDGLWKTGTYWHLATRPFEEAAMDDDELKSVARAVDRKLREATFQTLVHGDAKPTNFCFARKEAAVAAVDFQYVGGGVGVKDIAYLVSCEDDLRDDRIASVLDEYFWLLREALERVEAKVDAAAVENEWRAVFPFALVDFYRFYAGWAKEHWSREAHARTFVHALVAKLG